MMGADPGGARAVPRPLRHLDPPGRSSAKASQARSSGSTRTRPRARSGRATTAFGDDKDRPLVRSADGGYLYFAADVAYVADKLARGFDRAIYVLGADHHGYVGRLKAAAGLLGFDPTGSRCSSTSSSPRRARRDEADVETAR